MNQELVVSAIAADPHLRNGFYVFDQRIYTSKIRALIDASQRGSDIQFYYNDHVYGAHDWSVPPGDNLPSLYAAQARLIREKYDYLILMFSGGSDSTNMLRAFLDNQIKIDEIWSMVALTNTCDKYDLPNIEITLSAMPLLKQASAQGIRVEMINQTDWDSPLAEDWFLDAPGVRLSNDSMMRKNLFLHNPRIKGMVDSGQRLVYVCGYDKPRLVLDNDVWYLGFLDFFLATNWSSQHLTPEGPWFEWFYYDPDMPEVLVKSCHELIDWFEALLGAQGCRQFFQSENSLAGPQDIDLYRKHVNQVLYQHSWDEQKTFSLGKNRGRFWQLVCQKCSFVLDHSTHWDNWSVWQRGIESVQASLDTKFYKPWRQIQPHWSQLYRIRDLRTVDQ